MAIAAGIVLLLIVTALFVLVDDPTSNPPRVRERIVLSDEASSELTGAVVSIGGDPIMLDVTVGGRLVCSFEVLRPKIHYATDGGRTWVVLVRRIDLEQRMVDVRVDWVPDSVEPDGCRTADRDGS